MQARHAVQDAPGRTGCYGGGRRHLRGVPLRQVEGQTQHSQGTRDTGQAGQQELPAAAWQQCSAVSWGSTLQGQLTCGASRSWLLLSELHSHACCGGTKSRKPHPAKHCSLRQASTGNAGWCPSKACTAESGRLTGWNPAFYSADASHTHTQSAWWDSAFVVPPLAPCSMYTQHGGYVTQSSTPSRDPLPSPTPAPAADAVNAPHACQRAHCVDPRRQHGHQQGSALVAEPCQLQNSWSIVPAAPCGHLEEVACAHETELHL